MLPTTQPVIIVGAGLAGLAAARYLKDYGINTILLEARSESGGRTRTKNILGVPFDLGAAWIHGTINNPITELAKQANIRTARTEFEPIETIMSQPPLFSSREQILNWNKQFFSLLEETKEFAHKAEKDCSLFDAVMHCKNQKNYDLPAIYLNWYLSRLSAYTGGPLYNLSAKFWDLETHLEGGNYLLLDGTQPIVDSLSDSLVIQHNSVVTRIESEADSVKVYTPDNIFKGQAVIVTVPLGVLKRNLISFYPQLPVQKVNAISKLGMGVANKVLLQFKKVFWPKHESVIGCITPATAACPIFVNYYHYYQEPILMAYYGGDAAYQLKDFDNPSLINRFIDELSYIFGGSMVELVDAHVQKWEEDPFTFGSYSYIARDCTIQDIDNLASPSQRVFFAGEATHREFPATIHGAYLSGEREAKRVLTEIYKLA